MKMMKWSGKRLRKAYIMWNSSRSPSARIKGSTSSGARYLNRSISTVTGSNWNSFSVASSAAWAT